MPSLTIPAPGLVTFDLAFEPTSPDVEHARRFDVTPEAHALRIDWTASGTRVPVHVWLTPSTDGLLVRVEADLGSAQRPGKAEFVVDPDGRITGGPR